MCTSIVEIVRAEGAGKGEGGPGARVAVEISLESAKALSAVLVKAIAAAEEVEEHRPRGT